MSNQTLSELVKTADKITIDEIKGKKVILKISWFDVKGAKKTKKFLLNEKDKIEFQINSDFVFNYNPKTLFFYF